MRRGAILIVLTASELVGGALLPALSGASGACGSSLRAPPFVRQPTSALAPVPYPPPPARVERVPNAPTPTAVWVDGEWLWQGRRWAWKPGRWVAVPPGAAFAPWTTVRDATGTLYVAQGTWRDAQGNELPDPTPLAVGTPNLAQVVNPEGERLPPSPTASPSATPGVTVTDAATPYEDASLLPDSGISDAAMPPEEALEAGAPQGMPPIVPVAPSSEPVRMHPP